MDILFMFTLLMLCVFFLLCVEGVRHPEFGDGLIMIAGDIFRLITWPFRFVGSSLGQLFNPKLTVVQIAVDSNEEEEVNVRD